MQRLIDAGLADAGLLTVDTPFLVARYNNCLEQLGIAPTRLEKFRIDCIGWSPDVAQEKGDEQYLCQGVSNRMIVILTPDQRWRPIYRRQNSFERRMMDHFFSAFEGQIADITATHAVVVTVDQGLTDLANIQDLLLLDHVTLTASTDGTLMDDARSQRSLVDRFMDESEAWFDPDLRSAIIESAKKNGDLRERKLDIRETIFSDLRSFYTEAFGGVFVIRTEPGLDDLLVVQDKEALGTSKRIPKNIMWIHDPKLLDRLFEHQILEINFQWFRENPQEIEYRLECLAADALCAADGMVDFMKTSLAQRRKMLLGMRKTMPGTYFELERFSKMLERGVVPDVDSLSRELQLVLLHPSGSLPSWYREVVWKLICRLTQFDPLRLYIADKPTFFTQFPSWPDSKQVWAVNILKQKYTPHAKRKGA